MQDLLGLTARELLAAIAEKRVSAVEVMEATYRRLALVNPRLNAVVSVLPEEDALALARAADAKLAAGELPGALHGLPFAVKDLEETAGIRTTYGSPLYADNLPAADSPMVARLRQAGALIIGKTNVPEFGFGSQTYNPVFGATRNAYQPEMTAGGSSGGAAVALAARMLALADGSDHGGSLRNPAAFNNVFGLRPSPGLIPDPSPDAFSLSLATLGPMARNVPDLALLLSVQAGADPAIPVTWPEKPCSYHEVLQADLTGARIGWLGDLGGVLPMEPGILALCEAGLQALPARGLVVEAASIGFDAERIWESWAGLRAWSIAHRFNDVIRDPYRRDLLKSEAQWEVEQGLRLSGLDVARHIETRTLWMQQALQLFARHDYLALPSAQVFPFPVETHWPRAINGVAMDSYHRWMQVVTPVTLAGLPALNVPVGFNARGLPMGMQLIGRPRDELGVLRLGHLYDEATGWSAHAPAEP